MCQNFKILWVNPKKICDLWYIIEYIISQFPVNHRFSSNSIEICQAYYLLRSLLFAKHLSLKKKLHQHFPHLRFTEHSGQCDMTCSEFPSWRPMTRSEGDKVIFTEYRKSKNMRGKNNLDLLVRKILLKLQNLSYLNRCLVVVIVFLCLCVCVFVG